MSDRVLILGGYGVFGGRIAAALAREDGIEVLVAGRDGAAAARHCAVHGGMPVTLDRDMAGLEARIADLAPEIVIDAAGPFQGYGPDPYRLARAALAAGAHYLDLSDDAAFTAGIAALDGMARGKGLTALSGVSSVPAISSAAVAELSAGMADIHLIDTVILPGNRAPRGLSVIRAILAQAGRPLGMRRGAREEEVPGWSGLTRIALPGLSWRWASFIGAPDLVLFPDAFRARSVTFRAGLELSVMHLALAALALPVRIGLVRSLVPLARPLRWLADRLERFGSDRGGMRVRVLGITAKGMAEERVWTLIAEAGDGPHVPALPARILTGMLLAGQAEPGARACIAEFGTDQVARAAEGLRITTGTERRRFAMLFPLVLGDDFSLLPERLRDLHRVIDRRHWAGRAEVTQGSGWLARVAAGVMRFPPSAADVPVTVRMDRTGGTEVWTRDFAGRRFRSHLRQERDGGMTERFGPLRFGIGLRAAGGRLEYPVTAGWFLGIPLPRFLLPRSASAEAVDDEGRATFDVALSHPATGLIVRYRGLLEEG